MDLGNVLENRGRRAWLKQYRRFPFTPAFHKAGIAMREYHRPGMRRPPSLSFVLLCTLLVVLWIAGGASRGDVAGQIIVRGASWAALLLAALFGPRPALGPVRPVLVLLCCALGLAVLQLIPLPPALWQSLPGRGPFLEAAAISGQAQPWRSWAIVPGAAVNAVSSLVVPFATLILVAGLREREESWLPGLLLGLITAAMLIGLLQFSGVRLDNPLINDSAGEVGGTFANRNHFALFLSFGCLLAPVWAFLGGRQPGWRGPLAIGLVLLFALTILATGSRAGIGLGILGIVIGVALTRKSMQRTLSHYPRWVGPAIIAASATAIVALVALSIAADRAVSINRALSVDPAQDMRSRGLPTVLAMIREYFPVGAGFGGFDPLFRLHEPFGLLKFTYFNHAHNDLLEVILDAGVAGLVLLLAAIAWWLIASIRAWRNTDAVPSVVARLGSSMLLFILFASAFDYPARTPMMMAVAVVAACWLNGTRSVPASALPTRTRQL